jgi:hypothetical protein
MHARVATFEGGQPDQIREMVSDVQQRGQSGPPEGVPAVGFLMLHRADEGKVVAISLFETEDDLRQGDAALNEMNPPTDTSGRRTSVEFYEVGAKFDS